MCSRPDGRTGSIADDTIPTTKKCRSSCLISGAPISRAVRSSRRRGDTEKHDNRTIEPHEIGVLEGTDLYPKFGARHRSQFVDHESARFLQAVERGRFNVQAEQRGVGRVRGEGTDGDRVGVEAVVLDDHCEPRLPGMAGTACNGPDISPPHSSGHEETESMNSWSSAAATLAATAGTGGEPLQRTRGPARPEPRSGLDVGLALSAALDDHGPAFGNSCWALSPPCYM